MYIIDVDDFHEDNQGMKYLKAFKNKFSNFKVNLFTIIGKCSPEFIKEIKDIDWIDMIPHGWMHDTSRECEDWSYEVSKAYLDRIGEFGLTKGFKAPGWQISDGMYKALLEKGYWVADQDYNNFRRPKDLKCYLLDNPNKLHFHIQNVCGNGLEESFNKIINLKNNSFGFIKENI